MKRSFSYAFLLCMCLGCSGGGATTEDPNIAPPAVPMKAMMEQIAESGEIGGSGMNFSEELEKLKAADPAKAAKVEKDLEELIKLMDPEAIKAKAKQIASSL